MYKKLERYFLVKDTTLKPCGHCDRKVAAQVIECTAHRLGTDKEHFKHRCKNCNCYVFDGSIKVDPYKIRSRFYYYPSKDPQNPKLSIHGKPLGRPPKPRLLEEPKRSRGRPRKQAK